MQKSSLFKDNLTKYRIILAALFGVTVLFFCILAIVIDSADDDHIFLTLPIWSAWVILSLATVILISGIVFAIITKQISNKKFFLLTISVFLVFLIAVSIFSNTGFILYLYIFALPFLCLLAIQILFLTFSLVWYYFDNIKTAIIFFVIPIACIPLDIIAIALGTG